MTIERIIYNASGNVGELRINGDSTGTDGFQSLFGPGGVYENCAAYVILSSGFVELPKSFRRSIGPHYINLNTTNIQQDFLNDLVDGQVVRFVIADPGIDFSSVATIPSTPAAPSTNVLGSTSIRVTGVEPANGGEAITSYDWRYRETGAANWISRDDQQNLVQDFTGLNPSTEYEFQLRATNSVGDSGYSPSATATTQAPPATVPSTPAVPTPNVLGSTSIRVVGVEPADGGSDITSYDWRYRQTGSANWITRDNQQDLIQDFTNLSPSTEYEFQFRATNAVGDSSYSPSGTASTQATPATVPSTPAAPSTNVLGSTSIRVTGVEPANGGEAITSYDWRYRETGAANAWSARSNQSDLVQDFIGLNPSTEYEFQFRATNAVGNSGYSPSGTATTQAASATNPVGFFDVGVVPGYTDPDVDGAIPGCVFAFTRTGQDNQSGNLIVRMIAGGRADDRWHATQRIPPSYIEGDDDAYVTLFFMSYLGFDPRIQFRLQDVSSGPGSGAAGPQFTDDAEANFVLLIRADDGTIFSWNLSDLVVSDTSEPYDWSASGFDDDDITLLNNGPVQVIIVDRSSSNVDLTNRRFLNSDAPVATIPETPAAPATNVLGSTSIRVTGVEPANGGSVITSYDWRYRATGAANWIERNNQVNLVQDFTNLNPSTEYEFQLRATNTVGDSEYSPSGTDTTQVAPVAPSRPAAPATNVLGSTSIRATGVAPNAGTSPITSYDWRYRQTSSANWINRNNQVNLVQDFANLQPSTEYEFQFRATTSVGDSDYSPSGTASTQAPPATVPANPVAPVAVVLGTTSIRVTGVAPNNGGSPITSYDWRYRRAGVASFTNRNNQASLVQTFTGLQPSTLYEFQFRATNNVGDSNYSPIETAVTNDLNVPPVVNITTQDQSVDSGQQINLSATATDQDGSVVSILWSGFGVFGTPNSNNTTWRAPSPSVQTDYVLRFTATDDDGATAFSEITITVRIVVVPNVPPTVGILTQDRIVNSGEIINLEAISSDSDGIISQKDWTGGGVFGTPNEDNTSWTAPSPMVLTQYVLTYSVTDDDGGVATDTVTITVRAVVVVGQDRINSLIARWLITFEGRNANFWSGDSDITIDGVVYVGVGNIIEISNAEMYLDSQSNRLTLRMASTNEEVRKAMVKDTKLYVIVISWAVSVDNGKTFVKINREYRGLTSLSSYEDGVYSVELEPTLGDIDRDEPRKWTDENHRSVYPNDKGFSFLPDLVDGVRKARWPP